MTRRFGSSKGIGGLPDSEIEKLEKLRQAIGSQLRPAAGGKPKSEQENDPVTNGRFCQRAKKVPKLDFNIPFLTLDRKRLDLSPVYIDLSGMIATAAYNTSSRFVLSWPSVMEHPSLSMVLTTLSFYSSYNGQELRILYWPAKTNAMDYLRGVCINAQWLRGIAAQVATKRSKKGTSGTSVIFREKTLALLRLEDFIDGSDTPLSLNEYISAYHYKKDGTWIRRPDGLLESVAKAVSQNRTKATIRGYAAKLDRPEAAVDSIFCLHPELDLNQLKHSLQSAVFDVKQGGIPPNLVFLDLRAVNRFQTEKWFEKLQHIFQHFQSKSLHAPTGILILLDSPLVYENLRHQFESWHFPQDVALERYQPKFAAIMDIDRFGWVPQGARIVCPPKVKASVYQQAGRLFRVQVTDRQTALLVNRFLDLAKEVRCFSGRANKVLYDAAKTLSDISMLPGGMQALETWLIERLEDSEWKKSGYAMENGVIWKKKAIALDNLMNEGELGNFYGTAKNLLNEADEYIRGIQKSTPAGKALEAALEKSLKSGEQGPASLMVVVDRQHHFYLAQRMISERFGTQNKIQVCLTRELSTLKIDSATSLICLFSNHTSIRYLFMLQQAPRSGWIIIGYSRANKLMELLNVLLKISEYKKFHPLAERLISQLKKCMVDIAIPSVSGESIDLDESLPDTGMFDSFSSVNGAPRDKVIVRFATHPPEVFSPRSAVFLLDRDSSWGYRSEVAMNLEKGDILLVLPKSVKDQIMERLEAVYSDKSIEAKNHVRGYQESVRKRLEIEKQENNGTCSPKKISQKINEQTNPQNPVKPSNVRYWIGFEDSEPSDMTTLVPHAPKTWEHFKAFSIYLGLPEFLARKVFVYIRMVRRFNRKEGRQSKKEALAILTDEYSYHDSEIYPADFIQEIRNQAQRHSFQIQQVFKPKLSENDIRDIYLG
ncbi:hypothetical protein [Desulfobacter sp.]|uniref:hypothetical protein n=1 Tax=Desulfobacter sp. TaxID=2294 RepID=UPI003D1284EF